MQRPYRIVRIPREYSGMIWLWIVMIRLNVEEYDEEWNLNPQLEETLR